MPNLFFLKRNIGTLFIQHGLAEKQYKEVKKNKAKIITPKTGNYKALGQSLAKSAKEKDLNSEQEEKSHRAKQ